MDKREYKGFFGMFVFPLISFFFESIKGIEVESFAWDNKSFPRRSVISDGPSGIGSYFNLDLLVAKNRKPLE